MVKKVTPVRVVLDTNVVVSALLFGGQPGKLRDLWVGGRSVPLVSKETFAEFNKVLAYPKFRLSTAEIATLVEEEVLPYAVVVDVTEDAAGTCRDSHDDKFVALAVSGQASYLVTGDQDLPVLQSFGNVRIVSVSDFWRCLANPRRTNIYRSTSTLGMLAATYSLAVQDPRPPTSTPCAGISAGRPARAARHALAAFDGGPSRNKTGKARKRPPSALLRVFPRSHSNNESAIRSSAPRPRPRPGPWHRGRRSASWSNWRAPGGCGSFRDTSASAWPRLRR